MIAGEKNITELYLEINNKLQEIYAKLEELKTRAKTPEQEDAISRLSVFFMSIKENLRG